MRSGCGNFLFFLHAVPSYFKCSCIAGIIYAQLGKNFRILRCIAGEKDCGGMVGWCGFEDRVRVYREMGGVGAGEEDTGDDAMEWEATRARAFR